MRLTVYTSGLVQAIARMHGGRELVKRAIARAAEVTGREAVAFVTREFRSGPTSATTTQVRSGALRRNYDHSVEQDDRHTDLGIGLIKPGLSAEVLNYGRLLEGLNADGSSFASKVIRPKNGKYLTFPLRDPNTPGLASSTIIGWARVRSVTFRPRPSFPAIAARFAPILRDRVAAGAVEALQ